MIEKADIQYRRVCAQLRSATRMYTFGKRYDGDLGFLAYCEQHAVGDGPRAAFTPEQLDRLDRLGNAKMPRGREWKGDFTPEVGDVLAAIEKARALL